MIMPFTHKILHAQTTEIKRLHDQRMQEQFLHDQTAKSQGFTAAFTQMASKAAFFPQITSYKSDSANPGKTTSRQFCSRSISRPRP
jgi:hypothetical protein